MNHLLFFGGVLVLATLLANMEIQVEGPHGWAKSLPTWRVDNRFTRAFLSGKPLTGYHLYLFSFIFIFSHLPFLLGVAPWTIGHEMRVVSFVFLFWLAEDFLWFVLNPAFGLSKFKRIHIWWHAPDWWWIAPRDYWVMALLGGLFYVLSCRIA